MVEPMIEFPYLVKSSSWKLNWNGLEGGGPFSSKLAKN